MTETDSTFPPQTFFLPETFGPTILLRRAERLRKLTGNDLIKTRWELENPDGQSVLKMGANNIKMAVILCGEPAVFYSNLYIGLLCTYKLPLCRRPFRGSPAPKQQRKRFLSFLPTCWTFADLSTSLDSCFYLWFESFVIVFAESGVLLLSARPRMSEPNGTASDESRPAHRYHGMNLGVSQLPFLGFVVTGALTLLGKHLNSDRKFEANSKDGVSLRARTAGLTRRMAEQHTCST